MKLALVLLVLGLCALFAHSAVVKEQVIADQAFLRIQRDVLSILENVNQPSYNQEFVKIGNSYNISDNAANYRNQSVVQNFLQYYNYGSFLPRGQIFSVFYREQLLQAISLFKLFYYANNYDTFYKTAVWARQNLNEGLFLYSYIVAVVHRPDTRNVVLPPIYEIYPYYFFPTEVIQQAYIYKQQYGSQNVQEGGNNDYTINANYSGYYLNLNQEQSLSYYLEDIGINSYYYTYNVYYPFWLSSEEFGFQNVNRGEQYYFFYQQLLARYYLERLSNGLGEIPFLDLNVPFETPYYPSLEYPNGLEFPSRPAYANLYEYFYNYGQSWTSRGPYGYSRYFVQDYERRISDAVDSGFVFSESQEKVNLYSQEGLNILGNLIQANPDSPNYRYYGAIWLYGSHLLGYSYQPLSNYQITPSALEQFETALRDPAFYQLYKRILLQFQKYFYNQQPYTANELVWQGVEITNFVTDKLVTYNDPFYVNISNAVYYSSQEQQNNFDVRVRQYRLNSRPFTFKITVQSERETRAVVRVFLGPRYDQYGRYINITQNRQNFVLLDYFVSNLNSGENVITRNSYDSSLYAPDATSYIDLYRQLLGASGGEQSFSYSRQNYFSFPQRYILPRGTPQGSPYQFYVIVYPYQPRQSQLNQNFPSYFYPYVGEQQFYDSYSLGYPFDRYIANEQFFYNVPNSYFYQTNVYYRENINAVQN